MGRRTTHALPVIVLAVALGAVQLGSVPSAGWLAVASPAVPSQVVPSPEDCTVPPRPAAFFRELAGGTPESERGSASQVPPSFAMPAGEPASETVGGAVAATVIEAAACRNAGDLARLGALYTTGFFRRNAERVGDVARTLTDDPVASPVPEREERMGIVAFREVRELADGRVAALVLVYEPTLGAEVNAFYLLVRVDDQYLIDEHYLDPFGKNQEMGTPSAIKRSPPWG